MDWGKIFDLVCEIVVYFEKLNPQETFILELIRGFL